MIFFIISVFAGFLTVLAPCILPLLPIIIGATEPGKRGISKRAIVVILSLSISVIVFTLLLKATTLFIDVPQIFWSTLSGIIVIILSLATLFPDVWAKVPYINSLAAISSKSIGVGFKDKNYKGDILIGFSLGPIFTTCSPTYLFIIATVLPASLIEGILYLTGYVLGLSLSLVLIAYFGQLWVNKLNKNMEVANKLKKVFGIIILFVGLAIITGIDKKIESLILDSGYEATINLENFLIEQFSPINTLNNNKTMNDYSVITLAGGCFWCTEAYFQEQKGVINAVSGYAGGEESDATYILVSTGTTKHREAVQVTYDEKIISTEEILDIYWSHIDPTNPNGQFADIGFQYTAAIYYHTNEQKITATESKSRLERSGLFDKLITTEIVPFTTFFEAEEYHQDYYKKSAEYYKAYKKGSGREGFVSETWAKEAAIKFLKSK